MVQVGRSEAPEKQVYFDDPAFEPMRMGDDFLMLTWSAMSKIAWLETCPLRQIFFRPHHHLSYCLLDRLVRLNLRSLIY